MKTFTCIASVVGIFCLYSCGTKVYRLKCDSTVPIELAETIESKVYVEGDNPLFGEDQSRILISIRKGSILGLKHKVGKFTTTLPLDTDENDPPIVVSKCDWDFIICATDCGPAPIESAPDPEQAECNKKCQALHDLCKCRGGGLSGHITIL